MAHDSVLHARLRFLNEAAHLTAIRSPTASAAISQARDRLLVVQDADLKLSRKDWDTLRREVCGACGNRMVPGWSSKVTQQRPGKLVGADGKEPPMALELPLKVMVYSCLRCHRKTEQALNQRHPKHIKKGTNPKMHLTPAAETSESRDGKVTKSANATSKQRAKARKGGLQALLTQNKSQTEGLGLDLMDFMK